MISYIVKGFQVRLNTVKQNHRDKTVISTLGTVQSRHQLPIPECVYDSLCANEASNAEKKVRNSPSAVFYGYTVTDSGHIY